MTRINRNKHAPISQNPKYWTVGAILFRNDPADERHGTQNGYGNLGCRCHRCTEHNTAFHLAYMQAHPEQYEKQRLRNRLRYWEAKVDA